MPKASSDLAVRRAEPRDEAAAANLWYGAFPEDGPEYALAFMRNFDSERVGIAATLGGETVGAAQLLYGTELVPRSGGSARLGYLYAVCVAEAHRGLGIGKAITRYAAEVSREAGCRAVGTIPARRGLHSYYAALGFNEIVAVAERRFAAQTVPAEITRLTDAEYNAAREARLAHAAHVRFSAAWLRFTGADYIRIAVPDVGNAIAAVTDGGIAELLCAAGDERAFAGAVAANRKLGTITARFPAAESGGARPFALISGAAADYWGFALDM